MIRFLRSLHGWLGFFVMPWIIVMGLTGLYMNHSKLVLSLFPSGTYDEKLFDVWPSPSPVDEAAARAIAAGVFPEDSFTLSDRVSYHDRSVILLKADAKQVIVSVATGHYWVKTRFTRKTFDPDGRMLDSRIYWGTLFKSLHRYGWIDGKLGSWLADITAGAMTVFGLTGMIIFLTPRLRRRKNRKARVEVEVKRSNTPRPQRIKLKY